MKPLPDSALPWPIPLGAVGLIGYRTDRRFPSRINAISDDDTPATIAKA